MSRLCWRGDVQWLGVVALHRGGCRVWHHGCHTGSLSGAARLGGGSSGSRFRVKAVMYDGVAVTTTVSRVSCLTWR